MKSVRDNHLETHRNIPLLELYLHKFHAKIDLREQPFDFYGNGQNISHDLFRDELSKNQMILQNIHLRMEISGDRCSF